MNLCLIAPIPPPFGGVANWTRIVGDEIKKHDDMNLTLINIAANKRLVDGRTILDKVFYSGFVMIKSYLQLMETIKNDCPDVVHMTTSGGMGFFRDLLLLKHLNKHSIPSIYHVHFGRAVKYKEENGRCWKQMIRAVSLANATIVLDDVSFELLKPYAKKIIKINNPIDADSYKGFIDRKQEKNRITYIGWVIKPKGIEELLSAFHIFNEKHEHGYMLELIGPANPAYIRELREKYDTMQVSFLGEMKHGEAMVRLASAGLFILPSYTEGFPNVVLEAMALKKCIIATDVGAIPEMLNEDAGILIKSQSVEEIVMALENTLDENYSSRIAENAYRRVCELYDIKPTYEKYKDLWENVMTHESWRDN